jgi:hypothetical protein
VRAAQQAFWVESSTVEEHEHKGGVCPTCRAAAQHYECWQCCEATWMISCPHRPQPLPMRHGRRDGSDGHRVFCADCSAPVG